MEIQTTSEASQTPDWLPAIPLQFHPESEETHYSFLQTSRKNVSFEIPDEIKNAFANPRGKH